MWWNITQIYHRDRPSRAHVDCYGSVCKKENNKPNSSTSCLILLIMLYGNSNERVSY